MVSKSKQTELTYNETQFPKIPIQSETFLFYHFFFNASGQQFRGGASEQEFGTGDLRARIQHHKWAGGPRGGGGQNVQTNEIKPLNFWTCVNKMKMFLSEFEFLGNEFHCM